MNMLTLEKLKVKVVILDCAICPMSYCVSVVSSQSSDSPLVTLLNLFGLGGGSSPNNIVKYLNKRILILLV